MKNTCCSRCSALAVAPHVDAQDGSAYYGLALGEFDYDENDGFGELFTDTVSSWRLMINYQFMEHLGVEGGYGQTGTIRDTFTVPDVPFRARSMSTYTRVPDLHDPVARRAAVR